MLVNTAHFCALSSHPDFLRWLAETDRGLYNDLVAHLQAGKGCKANTDKMLGVLGALTATQPGEQRLFALLREKFPQALARRVESPREMPIFGFYDPTLVTLPRRIILESAREAEFFLASQTVGEFAVVGGRAYVEYLPPELAHLVGAIPDQNWLVRVWKSTQQQS